ncbi:hypothetical protein SteCoe_35240 [Stentor coeruleus]|uniref:Uncharacterized protein n=1 Tax=Stentor coeruleus TaxID=5963 RepID=A0A1R2ASQ9_9CILI|nr:hypothetical protein SteCoe_35240 [Stentor coeruleus]
MKARMKNFSIAMQSSLPKLEKKYQLSEISGQTHILKLPSNEDYSRMLKKLELVINNANYGQTLIILKPEKPVNLFIDEGKGQLVHIITKGYPSPMRIKFDKNYGQIRIYISKKIPQPTEDVYDQYTTNDIIEITEIEPIFKTQRVALFIKAISESNFIMTLKYGHNDLKGKIGDNEKDYELYDTGRGFLEEDSLDAKIRAQKIKEKILSRKKATSCENIRGAKIHKVERYRSVMRKHISDSTSNTKISKTLNLQKKPLEPRLKTIKLEDFLSQNRTRTGATQKNISLNFIKLLCFLQIFKILNIKLKKYKLFIQPQILIVKKKRITFKSIYKAWAKFIETKTLLEKSRLNLKFFKTNSLFIIQKHIEKTIIKHLQQLYILGKTVKQFKNFFSKIKLIQRGWKKYKLFKGFRLNKLEKLWGKMKLKAQKGSAFKRKDLVKYLIPNDLLRRMIENYYIDFMFGFVLKKNQEFEKIDLMFSSKKLFDYVTEARFRDIHPD